ncbi:hypothetical protein DYI95_010470 [Thermaerobacter sp. PB12/4term]|uniref:hypothetical protein n=1 Tax=Thermaerobacter sp. PB12/4term TaxID=2293838 RepID=UPI000E327182|nr:hypothetical protein [Thermaerobacter sp. PB12/4term]QIA27876.1 hypothetical protein DYI95_010470 [Thermaerobacter sp. PB12/4term]
MPGTAEAAGLADEPAPPAGPVRRRAALPWAAARAGLLVVMLAGLLLRQASSTGEPRWWLEVWAAGPAGGMTAAPGRAPGPAGGSQQRWPPAPLARWPVAPGQEVVLEYHHSMFRVPVRERFRVTGRGLELVAVEAPTPDIAWYYGDRMEARARLEPMAAAPALACPVTGGAWFQANRQQVQAGGAAPVPSGTAGRTSLAGGAWASVPWYRLSLKMPLIPQAANRLLGQPEAGGTVPQPAGALRVRATVTGRRSLVVGDRCLPLYSLVGDGGTAVIGIRAEGAHRKVRTAGQRMDGDRRAGTE